MESLLTTAEAAALAKRTRQTVLWWTRKGYLVPAVRHSAPGPGNGFQFARDAVLAAIAREPLPVGRRPANAK